MTIIGITERGDAGLDLSWQSWKGPKILITKAPQNLLNKDLTNTIVHCTITGHGGGILEPNVSKLDVTIDAYNQLYSMMGGDRVVLRVDPIIPTYKGLETAKRALGKAKGRIRISFLDAYPHVVHRLLRAGLSRPYNGLFHAPLEQRLAALKEIKEFTGREIEVCGEPDIECTGCVSALDLKVLDLKPSNKEGNQRMVCHCLAIKQELLTTKQPCAHGCLYCYWKGPQHV